MKKGLIELIPFLEGGEILNKMTVFRYFSTHTNYLFSKAIPTWSKMSKSLSE